MLFNIIMFIGMYPVVFIMYFVLKLNVKNRGGTVFGLCVPKDKDFAEEFYGQVNQRKEWYQYRMKQILFLLLVLPLITLKIPYVSLQFTFWMFWLVGGIVLMELPTVRVNRELKAFKKKKRAEMLLKQESEIAESGGSDKKSDYVRLVELSEAGQVRKTRLLPFLVPTLLSAAAVIYSFLQSGEHGRRQMVFVVLLFALCTPMFYMMASWMDRQRTAVVSYESEVNVNYARAKKQIWNRVWLMCAWVNTVFTIFSVPSDVLPVWKLVFCSISVFPHAHSIKSIAAVKTANARILFIVRLLSLHFSAQNFLMWKSLRFPSIHNRRQKPKSPSLQYIPQIRLPHSAQNQKTQTAA